MATKKPVKKQSTRKPASKKASKRKTGADRVKDITPIELTPEIVEERVAAADKTELWAEAWRLSRMGVTPRVIAARLGVSIPTVTSYVSKWETLAMGDPERVDARGGVLAHYNELIEQMSAELVQRQAWAAKQYQAAKDDGEDPVPPAVWLEQSKPLLDVLAAKARLVIPADGKGRDVKVTVEAASGLPGVAAALKVVTEVGDTENAA